MDGAANRLTKVGVELGMTHVKFISSEKVELVDSEAKFPQDISPVEGGGFDFLWGFLGFLSAGVRHGIVFKDFSEWVRL